jgi:hypothetical protein
MSGWVILVPFVLLGIFLRTRWLVGISALLLLFDVAMFFSEGIQTAGPGTYAGWAAIGFVLLSAVAIAVMWA